jgi:hypothetical protein
MTLEDKSILQASKDQATKQEGSTRRRDVDLAEFVSDRSAKPSPDTRIGLAPSRLVQAALGLDLVFPA